MQSSRWREGLHQDPAATTRNNSSLKKQRQHKGTIRVFVSYNDNGRKFVKRVLLALTGYSFHVGVFHSEASQPDESRSRAQVGFLSRSLGGATSQYYAHRITRTSTTSQANPASLWRMSRVIKGQSLSCPCYV
jgi:hypothetical protein